VDRISQRSEVIRILTRIDDQVAASVVIGGHDLLGQLVGTRLKVFNFCACQRLGGDLVAGQQQELKAFWKDLDNREDSDQEDHDHNEDLDKGCSEKPPS